MATSRRGFERVQVQRPSLAASRGRALLLSGLIALSSCRARPEGSRDAGVGCASVGERCEFSPGKLGTCIQRDGCEGAGCFVCQSQH